MKRVGRLGKAIFDTVTTRRRDDAIAACTFLVSYPRSGNTWLRYLLANLIEPTISWRLTNINDIVPDMYEVLDWCNSKPGTIIKSHEPYTATYPKVIYLYRDGRDVSISYFDYYSKVKGYTADFACFLREFLEGSVTFGSWQEHVSSWMFRDHEIPFLPLKYEDLVTDTVQQLERVSRFIGCPFSLIRAEQAMQRSTFERLKRDVRKFSPHASKGFNGGVKGQPGKWKEVYDHDMLSEFKRYAGQALSDLGYLS